MITQLLRSAALSVITRPTAGFLDTVSQHYRVLPTHIDFNMHVNNARYLEYFERARWDHAVQTGSFASLVRQGYNFIVAGIDVGYIRELKLWQNFAIETTFVGWDEKYFYLEQRCTVDGKIHAYALVKALYLQRGKPAAPQQVGRALGLEIAAQQVPAHIALWKDLAAAKRSFSQGAG
ncbi:MAG: integrase [Gammaproteobacteria bacterium]|nr:MAG: integrase [Gammaproteobacteria bacterium]